MSTLLQIHEPGETPAPHEAERGIAIGIDLGTTNSVAAIAEQGKPEILRDEHGEGLLPSIVAYTGAEPIVGRAAAEEQAKHPELVVASVKRLMGRGAADIKSLSGTVPYEIHGDQQVGMVRLKVGGRVLSPVEVSADILRAIKARAEEIALVESSDTGQPIRYMAKAAMRGAENFRFFADRAPGARDGLSLPTSTHLNYTMRVPIGPVGVITPWNTPFMLSTWKIAPALAAGCTVVHKPAEWSPLTATLLAEIMDEAITAAGLLVALYSWRLDRRPAKLAAA